MKILSIIGFMGMSLICSTLAGSITDSLREKLNSQGKSDAVLELPSVTDKVLSNPVLNMLSGKAMTSMMTSLMEQMSTKSQAPFMSALKQMGMAESVESFWSSNKIFIKNVDLPALEKISSIPGPFTIRELFQVNLIKPTESNSTVTANANGVQWGVSKIGAPAIWDKCNTGDGILVANIDTGVMGEHEALRDNYADQWFDAISGKPEPYDDDGHGTHTMGTICGQTQGIGVAPGARWVACKGLGKNGGTDVSLTKCSQWILKLDELPSVVSNSWGGGQGQTWFNKEIALWQKAGIIPVFAIGNSGPKCGTAGSPGDQENLISVGATTSSDSMASFSSRGKAKNSGVLKPDVSAPGQDIKSAFNNGGYRNLQGTSMACPHVAGAVALLQACRLQNGQNKLTYKQVYKKLTTSGTQPQPTNADLKCGKSGNGNYPNNAYGYGRINVEKAETAAA